ncbi:MAG: DUF898 domain-containing protein [Gammaproteobacteria bacterium]|nr:DUF898 domain-containing protein [Gammaproteobacteria bacterium]
MEGGNTAIAQGQVLPFEFTGRAGEYFSIWIVNVALTILTLGIYSAWAKVRTNQYFYGNTSLDKASFRYLADPKQILKGRVIAFILFLAYYFSGTYSPAASGAVMLLLILLFPAFLVMSMSFRLRNSSWRNVRFDFDKNFRKAYGIFAVPMLLVGGYVVVTIAYLAGGSEAMAQGGRQAVDIPWFVPVFPLLLMLAFPWIEYLLVRFRVIHSGYGGERFAFAGTARHYYGLYVKAFLILLAGGIVIALLVGVFAAAQTKVDPGRPAFIQAAMTVTFLLLYSWAFAYLKTKRTNLIFNNIDVGGHRLQSDLEVGHMMWLYVSNTLAILFSLGLLVPWAKIRTARYRASRTRLQAQGDLGEFANSQQKRQSALGEEVGEMFDVDLGF